MSVFMNQKNRRGISMWATPFIAITSDFNVAEIYRFRMHISRLDAVESAVVNCVLRLRH